MEKTAAHLIKASEVNLVYKTKIAAKARPCITSSTEAYQLFLSHWDHGKLELLEQTKVMYLNRGCKVLGIFDAATGGTTSTVMDIRIIYSAALKLNAASLIICHNHPSEILDPSASDMLVTKKVREAGRLLDIQLYDHLIITADSYYSFNEKGTLHL
jgi:DNA repair protein RadC